jgi:hypothetical protein
MIDRSAAPGSGMNCRPCWQMARSNDPAGSGSACASPSTHVTVGDIDPATASMSAFTSTPVTWTPSRAARRRATAPVPHATSTAAGESAADKAGATSSTSRAASGSNSSGTRCFSYRAGPEPAS